MLAESHKLGLQPTISPWGNRIDSIVSPERFQELFQAKLEPRSFEEERGLRGLYSVGAEKKVLLPTSELKVPDALLDEVSFAYVPTPPSFFGMQFVPPPASFYYLRIEDVARALNVYRCHRFGWTGRGIRIAMADTGFFPHPFFDDYGFDIHRITTPLTNDPGTDDSGHGTGESTNALVVAPDCSFVGVKHDDYSAQALETALAQNPRILTNSWGWNIDTKSMDDLKKDDPNLYNEIQDISAILAEAIRGGVTVIFSAGNGQRPFPACLPDIIAVGGVTVDADRGLKASSYASSFVSALFPNRRVPDLCGVVGEAGGSPQKGHIMLPVPNGSKLEGENLPNQGKSKGWGIFSGTSAAAPQVAGIAALMLSVEPDLNPAQIKSILMATSRDVTDGTTDQGDAAGPGPDLATGSGFVDAFAACLRVRQIHEKR